MYRCVQVRTAQSGDAIWIAVPRGGAGAVREGEEWVLDTVIERKDIGDLAQSIKTQRYDRQKYFMRRTGLRRLMYLVEGDPDTAMLDPTVGSRV